MRISPKVLLSMLLILSVVPLLIAPSVRSQVFTTITSRTTDTITSTINHQFSVTITVATTQTTSATTATLGNYVGGTGSCVIAAVWFNAPQQPVRIDYSSNAPIDIWVFSDIMWLQFTGVFTYQGHDACDPTGYATIHLVAMQRQGSAEFVMGAYVGKVLYLTYRRSIDPTVTPVVKLSLNGISMSITMTSTSSMIYQETQIQTVTATAFATREVPFFEANANWLVPLVLVAVIVVLFLALRMRKRNRRS